MKVYSSHFLLYWNLSDEKNEKYVIMLLEKKVGDQI